MAIQETTATMGDPRDLIGVRQEFLSQFTGEPSPLEIIVGSNYDGPLVANPLLSKNSYIVQPLEIQLDGYDFTGDQVTSGLNEAECKAQVRNEKKELILEFDLSFSQLMHPVSETVHLGILSITFCATKTTTGAIADLSSSIKLTNLTWDLRLGFFEQDCGESIIVNPYYGTANVIQSISK